MNGNAGKDVLEIDAIGVDEWEHEQHTPRAMDENLAALVKQSSVQSGPVRAPTLDENWGGDPSVAAGPADPAKQRTTTNTVARPAPAKTKTMALPTVAAPREAAAAPKPAAPPTPPKSAAPPAASKPAAPKPAAPKPAAPSASAAPQAIPRAETKAIVSPAAKQVAAKPYAGDEPPPGFVEVRPLAAKGAAKPPIAARAPAAATAVADVKPAAKSAAKPPPPSIDAADPKPTTKPTPPSIAALDPKPAVKRTPPAPAATPQAMAAVSAEPKRPPTPRPPVVMALPAWPPAAESDDWDYPSGAATSIDNRVSPSPPVSIDAKPEESVIVDLDAAPTASTPARPQSYPVIQAPERTPSPSTVTVTPTAAQPPPTAMPAGPDGQRASSPGWHTPPPQRMPDEPLATPAAPRWPSATGLVYEPSPSLAPAPLAAKRAGLVPFVRRRGVMLAIAGAAVLAVAIAIGSQGSHDSKQVTAAAPPASKTGPTASADSASPNITAPASAGAAPAPAPSAAEPVATSPKLPAKTPVATARISHRDKPVVVDYDKKPSSAPADGDQALAQARAAYSIGNQHLFAGEDREAIAAYRRALSIYPSYAAGYRGLGLAFAELDDKPSAIAAFKMYVKLAPAAKDTALIQKRIRSLSVH